MAHWFHRNPLKASGPVSFEALKLTAKSPVAAKICGDLKISRAKLLSLLSDPGNDLSVIETASNEYLSLLQGLCCDTSGQGGESKLRKYVMFKWTQSIGGMLQGGNGYKQYSIFTFASSMKMGYLSSLADAFYEMASMLAELALWYMKRASKVAGNTSVTDDEAKEIFKNMRLAAGIFQQVKDICASQLSAGSLEKHGDTDQRVLDAYHLQCLGEAQEVTVARSIELKHKPSVVSQVSSETSKLFEKADTSLSSIDPQKAGKWRKYLQLKKEFYQAYAYCFHGEHMLAEEKCGVAIWFLREAQKLHTNAGQRCKEYASTKGPGTTARPAEHQFFTRLGPLIRKTLEKAEHENGFIYHQKVPSEVPPFESSGQYGIASPLEFAIPAPNRCWTPEVTAAFDTSKAPAHAPPGPQENLKPVHENEGGSKGAESSGEYRCTIS